MNLLSLIKKRRSVRAYKDQAINEDKLKRILEAARLAPSAKNKQEWKFIVVKDKEKKKKLAKAAKGQSFVAQASVVIAGVSLDPGHIMSCDVPAYAVDLAIALDHVSLIAADEGLGTCWIGAFSQPEVKDILEVPETAKVVCLMTLGHPADSPGPKNRKDFEEVISHGTF